MATGPPFLPSAVRLVTVYARPARTRSGRVADTVTVTAGVPPSQVMGTATLTSVVPDGAAAATEAAEPSTAHAATSTATIRNFRISPSPCRRPSEGTCARTVSAPGSRDQGATTGMLATCPEPIGVAVSPPESEWSTETRRTSTASPGRAVTVNTLVGEYARGSAPSTAADGIAAKGNPGSRGAGRER